MKIGTCQLCGKHKADLVDGHIWPKFVYKKYVSDIKTGGSFLDLQRMRLSSRQVKQYWFCEHCDNKVLGDTEDYAAKFCERLEERPTATHAYDERLLRFAVSLSWRVARYYMGSACTQVARDILKKPCRQWKDHLRGYGADIRPYSQHLFIVFDPEAGLHCGLGGEVFPRENLMLSQIGPLYVVGLLNRKHLCLKDIEVWSQSEIRPEGGAIKPISVWMPGAQVTADLVRLLDTHEVNIRTRALRAGARTQQKDRTAR